MTPNEILGLTGGLLIAAVLLYYIYTANKHQRDLMKKLNKLSK